jgi:hypothetical protein
MKNIIVKPGARLPTEKVSAGIAHLAMASLEELLTQTR